MAISLKIRILRKSWVLGGVNKNIFYFYLFTYLTLFDEYFFSKFSYQKHVFVHFLTLNSNLF